MLPPRSMPPDLPMRAKQPLQYAHWSASPEASWPTRLFGLKAHGIAVVLADAPTLEQPRWLPAVRSARLVPGLRLTAAELDRARIEDLVGRGPLLVAIASGPGDGPRQWQSVRELLAVTRDPHLRIALLDVPACHSGPLRPDVPLRQTGGPSRDYRCQQCGLRTECPGPAQPTQPVQPVPAAVSNQFDLVQAAVGQVRLDDDRQFACDAQQWQQPEVREAVARGQLYLDVSDKARLDDFAADLRLLQPLPDGTWRVAVDQPFATEEALLLGHLRDLHGLVVDVGAGPIRYLEELREAMRSGRLRYLAVEPDPGHLAQARAALPEGRMVQGTGEHLPLPDGCADAVLFLRSVNHLHDLGRGLREAARVLKPGGRLLLVDNVAFGLLRTPERLQRAHAIPLAVTPFEHYRNLDAGQVVDLIQREIGAQVRVEASHPVRVGGSNQWLVLAIRTAPEFV